MGTISVPGTNCGGGRLYPSKDEVLWNLQNTISGSDRIEIAAYSTNQNLFYIAAQVASEENLYKSVDALLTTTAIDKPNDANGSILTDDFKRRQAFYDLVIEVDPTNDQIIYAGESIPLGL